LTAGGLDAGQARYVIAVAAPPGAGKSTLIRLLSGRLPDATVIQFDHYERITDQPIEKIRLWMENGADLNEMDIPGLAEDLQALKQGRSVRDPRTRAEIPARKYVLFETQFGRQHAATGRHIDFLIWIDLPLDIALARKVRQFTGEVDARNREEMEVFAPWLHTYLDNYLAVVGGLLRIQRDTVGASADMIVDGESDPGALLLQVEQEILRRLR
jgi:uridine kinase